MLSRLRVLQQRLSRKGFAGPHYTGLIGKVRFALESTIRRRELVFVLTPEAFEAVTPPSRAGFTLLHITALEQLTPYRTALETAWYPGLIDGWRGPWQWGERLFLGLQDGTPVSFNWLQVGTARGEATRWGRVLAQEYRIVRGGVAPSERGKGTNTLMKYAIIQELFATGASRVWAECYERNIPSVKTLRALGFVAIGLIEVLELPGLRGFIRWRPLPTATATPPESHRPSAGGQPALRGPVT